MADTAQTPEAVAFALLLKIADAEKWYGDISMRPNERFDRPWQKTRAEIFSTYRECIAAVRHDSPPAGLPGPAGQEPPE